MKLKVVSYTIGALGALASIALLVGCNGDKVSLTDQTTAPTQAVEPAPVAQAQPQAAIGGEASATIWEHGAVDVTGPYEGAVCYFEAGPHEQTLLGQQPVNVGAGQQERYHLPGDINRALGDTCVQIDVGMNCSRSSIIPGMLAAAYIGDCDNTPLCEDTWVALDPVRENYTEWSECGLVRQACDTPAEYTECEGFMYRTYEEVVVEQNSCDGSQRERSRRTVREESPCGVKCLSELVHTEKPRYCYTIHGENYCSKHWLPFSSKKWQCQSVPPGSSGHYPNHFDTRNHDDYFGVPDENHCYKVLN